VAARLSPTRRIVDAERRLARQLRVRARLLDALTASSQTASHLALRRTIDLLAASIRASELALAEAIAAAERLEVGSGLTAEEPGWLTTVGRDALSRLQSLAGRD
jgi:hypothetical protein